jgi:precorrin-3B synthase
VRTAADRCPGALRVHQAADGGLVRVRVPGGRLSAAQVAALASASARVGDGNLDLTSRGNVQLRGLRDRDALLDVLLQAGLLPSPAHDTARNIVASQLADLPVRELDAGVCADPALAELPGRFLLGLDDGSGDVQGLAPDLSLQGPSLVIGGRLAGPGSVGDLLAACRIFLALRTSEWRLAELADGAERIAAAMGRSLGAGALAGPRTAVGTHGPRVVAHVPFGRLTPAHLAVLGDVVLTPWHSVVVDAGTDLALFVTDPTSPWIGLTACVGKQCASSLSDVRADAVPGDLPTHWSGCSRRCGSPAGSRDLVATGNGYEVQE